MKHPNRIRNADYASLLRLAGEVGEIPTSDPAARRAHAVRGICCLLDASHGLFMHSHTAGGQVHLGPPVLVGYDDAPQDLLRGYFAGRYAMDPCALPMHQASPPGTYSSLRSHLVSDRDWYASEHVNTIRRGLGQDDAVYARLVGPAGDHFGQCFLRPTGARPFTERHRQIVHAFNVAAGGLFCLSAPAANAAPIDRLAPRLRSVAERFLAGDSVKEAARHLGLSRHTVVQYAKDIYRTLGVSTRAELLLVLMRGGRGEK